VAKGQSKEIPEIRVQSKVYDGRTSGVRSRNISIHQKSSLSGHKESKDRSSSELGSEADNHANQLDFDEQSDGDIRARKSVVESGDQIVNPYMAMAVGSSAGDSTGAPQDR